MKLVTFIKCWLPTSMVLMALIIAHSVRFASELLIIAVILLGLKEMVQLKKKSCHYLFTLMLLEICFSFFLSNKILQTEKLHAAFFRIKKNKINRPNKTVIQKEMENKIKRKNKWWHFLTILVTITVGLKWWSQSEILAKRFLNPVRTWSLRQRHSPLCYWWLWSSQRCYYHPEDWHLHLQLDSPPPDHRQTTPNIASTHHHQTDPNVRNITSNSSKHENDSRNVAVRASGSLHYM